MMTGEMEKEKGTCSYKMLLGNPCNRERYDDEYCIFHSKDKEKKDKFNTDFKKELEQHRKHKKFHDYKGYVFPGDIPFEGAVFEHIVSFAGAEFHGVANFKSVQFSGYAIFEGATFSGVADFGGAKFSDVAAFMGAIFIGGADFKYAQFYGEANFKGAKFLKKANSKKVIYNFNRAKFTNDAYFEDIIFGKDTSCVMLNTYFYNVIGLLEFIEEDKKKRKKDRIFKYPRLLNRTEFLPDNFSLIMGEEATARYPIISRKIRDDMYLLRFKKKHPKLHSIWWLFADCGRSFLRWALWGILFAVFFAFIYHNVFFLNDPTTFYQTNINIHETWPGFSFLYYSIVTFTTLGFGDIVPKPGWPQFCVALEVIMGYVMLGGLISILANKLARRS